MESRTTTTEREPKASTGTEMEIQNRLKEFSKAIQEGSLDEIMSFYAPEIVAFDMMPPLKFEDKSQYRDSWENFFVDYFNFPVDFNYHDTTTLSSGDVAFTHSLIDMKGTSKKGEDMEARMRSTIGWRKIEGKWLIVHEHNSVPSDPKTGQSLMNLMPGTPSH